jgi:hypothetical protein
VESAISATRRENHTTLVRATAYYPPDHAKLILDYAGTQRKCNVKKSSFLTQKYLLSVTLGQDFASSSSVVTSVLS